MYLYVYSDGTLFQEPNPPTESDLGMLRMGHLNVFKIENGRFQACDGSGNFTDVCNGPRD